MFSRILTSAAGVAFACGLLFYGMGSSYNPKDDGMMQLGLILGIAGIIGLVVGIVLYRQAENGHEAAARVQYGPDRKEPIQ